MGTGAVFGSPVFAGERSGEAPLHIMRRVYAACGERSAKMIYKRAAHAV